MLKELEKHFQFWSEKLKELEKSSLQAVKQMETDHVTLRKSYALYLDNIKLLGPRANKKIMEKKIAERILLQNQEFKDARYVRNVRRQDFESLVQSRLRTRAAEILQQRKTFETFLEKEYRFLFFHIEDLFLKFMLKRRKNFKKLWLKYIKVKRTIDSLHTKEKYQLKILESKKKIIFRREAENGES